MCDDVARAPAEERPLLTTRIGFWRPTRREIRANLRGLPIDSRYSAITSVAGSSAQYWMKSLPERSALLPTEMKVESPSERLLAYSMTARPSAPDCDRKPTFPCIGALGEKVAFMRTSSWVLMTPMQLGPMTRMPFSRAMPMSSRCISRPAGPVSANPAVITTMPWTPFWAHSRAATMTSLAGTTITARSTGPGMSRIDL